MADLRMQLAAYVEATIERVDVEDVLAARAVTERPVWARPIWRRPAVVALAAAAAAIVLIGGVALFGHWLTDRGPVGTTTSTLPPTTTTTTAAPTTTTAPQTTTSTAPVLDPATTAAWGAFSLILLDQEAPPQPGPSPMVNDLAAGESLAVAVGVTRGNDANIRDGLVAISPDGINWERVSDPDDLQFGGKALNTVAAGGPGFVMGGNSCDTEERCTAWVPALWTSADGRDWVRVPADPELFGVRGYILDLLVLDSEILALGQVCDGEEWETCGWVVLASPDGLAWERIWKSSVAFANSFAAGPVGLVAGAEDNTGANNFAAAWTSADGRDWQRVAHDPAVFGDGEDLAEAMGAIAGGVPGYVALGGNGLDTIGWFSPDGVAWERIPHDPGMGTYVTWGGVITWDAGFLAAGPAWQATAEAGGPEAPSRPTLWVSPDGRIWHRIPFGAEDEVGAVSALMGFRGMLILGGQDGTFLAGRAALWVNEQPPRIQGG